MTGEYVNHVKYGRGKITKEEDGYVYAEFGSEEKMFPYAAFEKFISCENPKKQQYILDKVAKEKEQIEISAKKEQDDQKQKLLEVHPKKARKKISKKYSSWIKFEGPQNPRQPHEMVSVEDNGKTLYILNYVKRPSGVVDGATVFMAAGIEDVHGVAQQSIIGRGILEGYSGHNEVKGEWEKKYDWMGHYKYYLVLKEFEVLDDAREKGLYLSQVLSEVGADTYPSSEGEDVPFEKLRAKHTQKMHMMITDKAEDYINKELDKIFDRLGSKKYRSER